MKYSRYKPVGWIRESYRHSLAAKGISTKYFAKKITPLKFKKVTGENWIAEALDSKGRTVRKYSKDFEEKQQKEKFARVKKLEPRIPSIIKKIEKDFNSDDEKEKQNAQAAYVIAKTGLRPGTEKNTKGAVKAFGVTTLEDRHVKAKGKVVELDFIGKKGVKIDKKIVDKQTARILKKRKSMKGKQLFTKVDDRSLRNYLQSVGVDKTKDLRTAKANELAKKYKNNGLENKEIIIKVSSELGNTPAVTKNSYIRPEVLNA